MYELTSVALEAGDVPIEIAGWGVLIAGIVFTILWLVYLYR